MKTPNACRKAVVNFVPGGCFIRPPKRPGPYLRGALGCSLVVSRRICFVAAPRGSNPRSRFNLQAGPRFGAQNRGSSPSCAATLAVQPRFNLKAAPGIGEALPGTGQPEKTRALYSTQFKHAQIARKGRCWHAGGRALTRRCRVASPPRRGGPRPVHEPPLRRVGVEDRGCCLRTNDEVGARVTAQALTPARGSGSASPSARPRGSGSIGAVLCQCSWRGRGR